MNWAAINSCLLIVCSLVSCAEETAKTKSIKAEYKANAAADLYENGFIKTVPDAYWLVCDFVVRDGFEFDKILSASTLDYVDQGTVSGTRSIALKYNSQEVLFVQQPIDQRNLCFINGWTNDGTRAAGMIAGAIDAIDCPSMMEVQATAEFQQLGRKSFRCGKNLLHAASKFVEQDKYYVGFAVESKRGHDR